METKKYLSGLLILFCIISITAVDFAEGYYYERVDKETYRVTVDNAYGSDNIAIKVDTTWLLSHVTPCDVDLTTQRNHYIILAPIGLKDCRFDFYLDADFIREGGVNTLDNCKVEVNNEARTIRFYDLQENNRLTTRPQASLGTNAVCNVLDSKKIGCTVDNKKFRINKFNGNIRKRTVNGWTKLNRKATVGKSYLSAKLSGKTFTINRQTAQVV